MGLNRDGPGLSERGVIYLETKMVSVLHKELEYKVEKFKFKKLEIMQPVRNYCVIVAGKLVT